VEGVDGEAELAKLVSDTVQQANGQLLGTLGVLFVLFIAFFSSVVALGLYLLWRSMPTQGVKDLLVSATEQFKAVIQETTSKLKTPLEVDNLFGNILMDGINKFYERIGHTPATTPTANQRSDPPVDKAPPPDTVPMGG
jgi:hypothetical protein